MEADETYIGGKGHGKRRRGAENKTLLVALVERKGLKQEFTFHGIVRHGIGEYIRSNVHTNTVEGYFSILKRGIIGVYQHVGEQHLHGYLSEFDFRYNGRKIDDAERSVLALCGIEGKRLTYQDSSVTANV